ncbi:helix-turn-helix domain-containing protein [Chryseobacterium sp. MHB01]|uniref:helix-turn-helix domain-containing protein n=1 Tax=Chryseobacterium sp. MHB01 TaxID=3109433 RepID=UPI002AFE9603|nr:helix-turn-helix domain-containing protein [Chryseobacterium sp. MHB01]MEA1849241.1 helix-turn-helix domain-containing protein [Chryseobacterium sp. MHB01]
MKNHNLPQHVKTQIEQIKANLLPQALIPNSRLYRKANLIEAEAVLEYAKSLKRPVCRIPSSECHFSKTHTPVTRVEIDPDLIHVSEVSAKVGVQKSTISGYVQKGKIQGVKINGKLYLRESEVVRLKSILRAKAINID